MRFEISERIKSKHSSKEIIKVLETQFSKISESISISGNVIEAKSIEATFGSINRDDRTLIEIREIEDEYLLVADISYQPSVWFWIFIVIGLFTWVFWAVPVVFYLLQKNTVKDAVKSCLERVKNEFQSTNSSQTSIDTKPESSNLDNLERYGELLKKGLITEEEFQIKKKELLGL